jgi:hypothetical protein
MSCCGSGGGGSGRSRRFQIHNNVKEEAKRRLKKIQQSNRSIVSPAGVTDGISVFETEGRSSTLRQDT